MPRKKVPKLTGNVNETATATATATTPQPEKAEIAQIPGPYKNLNPFIDLEAGLYVSLSEMLPVIIEMILNELTARDGKVSAINLLPILNKAAPIFVNTILEAIEGARVCF
jgi:hypothetical protein